MLMLAAALAACTAGCGPGSSGDDASGGHGAPGHDEVDVSVLPSKPSKPMTVQQLATGLGCEPELGGKYADYRLAWCDVNGTRVVLTDFDTAEGQRLWLEHSKDYGGVYLVGERWLVTGNSLKEISPLQDKFGGKIEKGDIHGPPPPASARPADK
ncbi:MAG TPA: hypothetical protein VH969_07055 [Actinophytocola sp.]|jgi:hypothetical protein|uniref:hypothetical protein n=1 Tax=Actinophytocola sp. TaxID=1872138 RepID=UPI002F95BB4C